MVPQRLDTVVIGGSAGGLVAATMILGTLPADFSAAVFVAIHRRADPAHPHRLTQIVGHKTRLQAQSARDGAPVVPGHVYVASGDHHLLLENGIIRVQHSPKENRFRPSIDVLFKSAAMSYGRRVIGILLTGTVVEDESVVATNLQQSLSVLGYQVIDWVPTGEAAIELAAKEHPDVVLMDIHLAGVLTGIEAARRIWQREQIPIVYCTAHGDLDTLKSVQTTQSYGYVMKPFQTPAVRAAIELALARREKELR